MAQSVRSTAIKSVRAVTLLAVASLLAMPGLAKAQEETWSQTGGFGITGLKSFDISWVDYVHGAYYLADRSNKAIDQWMIVAGGLHQFSGGFVGAFLGPTGAVNNDLSGPNGVLTITQPATLLSGAPNPASGDVQIWAGDGPAVNLGCPAFLGGSCSAAKVIDTATGALAHVIPTGGAARADELCYDSKDHLIQIANDAEADFAFGTPFITWISTDTYQIVGGMQIPQTTNGIEQCQWDSETGLIFLNIPEVGGPGNDTADGNVLAISPPSGSTPAKVVATYIIPTADCAGPQGMALGPVGSDQLVLGCNATGPGGVRNSLIISKHTGAVIAIAWGLGGADEAWSNDTHYFITGSSCTAATCLNAPAGSQFGIVDHTPSLDQVIAITPIAGVSSHSIAADCNAGSAASSGQVFLPVAGGVEIYTNTALDTDDVVSACPTQ
ncbi:MAG TPA: hypothetical protein VGJ20_44735 [Xanthobacteraceae bacterium]